MPVGAANCLSCGRSTGHRRPPRPQETTLRLEPGRPSRVEVRFNQRDPSRVLQGEPTRRPPEPNRAPQVEAKPRQPEPVGAPQVKATSHQSGLTGAPQVEVEPRPPEPGPASHVEVSFRHREPNDASQEEPTRRPPEPDRAPQAAARPPCTSAAQAPGDAVTVEAGGLALTRGMEHLRAASAQSPQGPPTVPRRAPATMAVVSFLVPLFGFVYSAIMLTSDDPTKAREGQLTLGASLLACVTLAAVLGGYLIAH